MLLSASGALCQSDSLALSSAATAPGGAASLSLSLTSASSSQPASLQWTVSYTASAVAAVTVTAGAVSAAAGKSVYCAGSAGAYTCLLTGFNQDTIPNGVVAVVNITLATTASTTAIGITNPLGSSPAGQLIPVTATGGAVTVVPLALSALTCSPTSLISGSSSTCTVTLNEAAPSFGAAVSLSSSSSALSVPTAVSVSGGANSAAFTAAAGTVATAASVTVTATLNGTSQQAAVYVLAPLVISSIGCNPSSLLSGGVSTCTVMFNRTVYSSGLTVRLTDNNALLAIPRGAAASKGTRTATFTALAATIPSRQTATITASLGGSVQTTLLTLSPTSAEKSLVSFACDEPEIVGGVSTQCTLQSSSSAPAGGLNVDLTASDSEMLVPSSVRLPAGSRVARFAVRTRPTDHEHAGTITARTSASVRQISISVLALKPVSLACTPHAPPEPDRLSCEVQLNARISEPVSLAVSGSRNILVPAAITTRPGQATLTFDAVLTPAASARDVFVQVRFGAQAATDHRLVAPTPAVSLPGPENILARFGERIDFTLPAAEFGETPARLFVSELPSSARFDAATARFTWIPDRSQQGSYNLVFTAVGPQGTGALAHVRITVGSGEPVATSLVNAASQSPDAVCSPGSVASLRGQWLDTGSAPRVYVNDAAVPVLSATATRVDFQCPRDAPGTPLSVWLENAAGRTPPLTTTLRNAAPGIFTLNGSAQGLILLDDSTLAAVRSFLAPGQPAQPGDEISIRATGLSPDDEITVKLGDVDALAASVQPLDNLPGVYDIRVEVPSGVQAGDAVTVRLRTADGAGEWSESNPATMAVELPRP